MKGRFQDLLQLKVDKNISSNSLNPT